jgi:flagellar P-ring protein precursor FlgI
MTDSGTVSLNVPSTKMRSVAHALGRIENIEIEPERKACVLVDQRSGIIVMGEDVRLSCVAVSQRNLVLMIQEAPLAVQSNPSADGETVFVPGTDVAIEEEPGIRLAEVSQGASLSEEIAGLNALGVAPRDMIDILKRIKAAGALHVKFIVN